MLIRTSMVDWEWMPHPAHWICGKVYHKSCFAHRNDPPRLWERNLKSPANEVIVREACAKLDMALPDSEVERIGKLLTAIDSFAPTSRKDVARLTFKRVPFEGVTVMYQVLSGKTEVGRISWWGPWRRYVLHTQDEIVFDAACLREVVDFLDGLMLKRKEEKK